MKVLFNTYPMAFHTPGGGEIQLKAYQKHLVDKGVEVTLFDQWNPNFLNHDLVHFFSGVGGSFHFCNFVKQLGLPLVVTSSLWITEETKGHYPIDEIRAQFSLADRIVTNSEMESDLLSKVLQIPRNRFSSVYNGVDDVFLQRPSENVFREHFKLPEKFVLNVGNIEPRKNQLRLAQAMKSHPDHLLILIGHVRDQSYLEQTLASGESGQVRYLGPLLHNDVLLRSAYQACDAFCLPSTLETPGLAALEAAFQGCKLVITEEGSTREYFGDMAHYADPNDTHQISSAIHTALQSKKPISSEEIAVFQHKFAWKQVVEQLKAIYESLK